MADDLVKQTLDDVVLRRQELMGVKRAFFVPNNKGTGGIFHVDGGKIAQVLKVRFRFR